MVAIDGGDPPPPDAAAVKHVHGGAGIRGGSLRKVNPAAEILFVSARTGEGVDAWCDWLRARL